MKSSKKNIKQSETPKKRRDNSEKVPKHLRTIPTHNEKVPIAFRTNCEEIVSKTNPKSFRESVG